MSTFIGFNTQNQYKKFTLVDRELIKSDLLNAFNITQGQLPGRPGYGTILWSFLFENQDQTTLSNIIKEVQRVAGGDPRVNLIDALVFPQENGVLIELEIQFAPNTNAELVSVFFNQQQRLATFALT
jgi:phage baseplate assembly protein W